MRTQHCTRETTQKKQCCSNNTLLALSLIHLSLLWQAPPRKQNFNQPITFFLIVTCCLFVGEMSEPILFAHSMTKLFFFSFSILPLQCIASLMPSIECYFLCSDTTFATNA
jgi:hypothetical protein